MADVYRYVCVADLDGALLQGRVLVVVQSVVVVHL